MSRPNSLPPEESRAEKPKSRKGLAAVSAVLTVLSLLINGFFLCVMSGLAFRLLTGTCRAGDAADRVFFLLFLLPVWLLCVPIPGAAALIVGLFGARGRRVLRVLLIISVVLLALNIAELCVLLFCDAPQDAARLVLVR